MKLCPGEANGPNLVEKLKSISVAFSLLCLNMQVLWDVLHTVFLYKYGSKVPFIHTGLCCQLVYFSLLLSVFMILCAVLLMCVILCVLACVYRCSKVPGVLGFDPAWSEDCVWWGHPSRALPPAHQGQEEALLTAVNGKTEVLYTQREGEESGKRKRERRKEQLKDVVNKWGRVGGVTMIHPFILVFLDLTSECILHNLWGILITYCVARIGWSLIDDSKASSFPEIHFHNWRKRGKKSKPKRIRKGNNMADRQNRVT